MPPQPAKTPSPFLGLTFCLAPLAGLLLCLVGYAIFNGADARGPWPLRSLLLMGTGGLLLAGQTGLALAHQRLRLAALAPLTVTLLCCLLLASACELIIPAPEPEYVFEQRRMQDRLERRNSETSSVQRGQEIFARYNFLGWNDENWSTTQDRPRVLLIGDSFLELMSARNVGNRLETLLDGRAEIINLGLAGTSPEEYAHRFSLTAQTLRPDLAIFFVYAGNDFYPGYTWSPQLPPLITISERAVAAVRPEDGISPALSARFSELKETSFQTPEALKDALGLGADLQRQLLLELAAAYSPSWESTRPIPTRLTLVRLVQRALRALRQSKEEAAHGRNNAYADLAQAFSLPLPDRLARFAEIAAQSRGGEPDAYLQKLRQTPESFQHYLLDEYENAVYLLLALDIAVNGSSVSDAALFERTGREYAKLFAEILDSARSQGVRVAVVLIPEASQIDMEFRKYWEPLADFRSAFHAQEIAAKTFLRELSPEISTVDLYAEPAALKGAYWRFDAHWNERGNEAVAEILRNRLFPEEAPLAAEHP